MMLGCLHQEGIYPQVGMNLRGVNMGRLYLGPCVWGVCLQLLGGGHTWNTIGYSPQAGGTHLTRMLTCL